MRGSGRHSILRNSDVIPRFTAINQIILQDNPQAVGYVWRAVKEQRDMGGAHEERAGQ